jgi:hypothetical protein
LIPQIAMELKDMVSWWIYSEWLQLKIIVIDFQIIIMVSYTENDF